MSDHQQHSSDHFIVPVSYYVATFVSLLVLTVITVAVAQYDFGGMNLIIAMVVATIKALLVALIFMGLRWEKGFNKMAFFCSFTFLSIFFLFTFSDLMFRKYRSPFESQQINLKSPVKHAISEGKVPGTSTH